MEFKKLECFIRLFEEQNFSQAADRMYMAQSSFSAQIKAIEDELNVILVNRSNRRNVSFTREGELFFEYCKTTLAEYGHLRNQLHNLSEIPIKNIGLFYSSRLDNWTQQIVMHNEKSNKVKYSILFSYGKEKVNHLTSGETFIALSLRNPVLDKLGFNFVHRYFDYDSLGIPYSHPLAAKESITPDDLKDLTLHVISPKRTFGSVNAIDLLINRYGLKHYNFKYLNRTSDLHYSMKTEGAIIMMPSDLMPESCKVIKLDFDEDFKLDYGWYYKEMNDDVRWVIDNL